MRAMANDNAIYRLRGGLLRRSTAAVLHEGPESQANA